MVKKPAEKNVLMILVHAGSACGSANMTLGYQLAHSCRDLLIEDLNQWTGHFLVIDGSFSDELPDYPRFHAAIEQAHERAKAGGFIAEHIWGCDDAPPHQDEAIRDYIEDTGLTPDKWRMELTGCWSSFGGGSGCVDDVCEELRKMGFDAVIRQSAVQEPLEDDDDEEKEDDED